MKLSVITFLASVFVFLQYTSAMNTYVGPGMVDCYFQELEVGEKLIVSFQVGEGGNDDIDFWIQDSTGSRVVEKKNTAGDVQVIQANTAGRFQYCFSNERHTDSIQKLAFNVHENAQKIHDSVKESTDPLQKEIMELAESVFNIKAQQEYIVARESEHRDTAESTNSRVKWWSIVQLVLLVSVCFWQVYYLQRFFEVKRAV
ncbi:COPII-coated vesicle protein [Sporodiniella umbellata]|nr:COPII-coated vesicle protein [Sporodiniella umbellata]